jgi:hypothetical protein
MSMKFMSLLTITFIILTFLYDLEPSSAFHYNGVHAINTIPKRETRFSRSPLSNQRFAIPPKSIIRPTLTTFSAQFRYTDTAAKGNSSMTRVGRQPPFNIKSQNSAKRRTSHTCAPKNLDSKHSAKTKPQLHKDKTDSIQPGVNPRHITKRLASTNNREKDFLGPAADQSPGASQGPAPRILATFDWPPKEPAGEGLPFGDGWRALYLDKQVSHDGRCEGRARFFSQGESDFWGRVRKIVLEVAGQACAVLVSHCSKEGWAVGGASLVLVLDRRGRERE